MGGIQIGSLGDDPFLLLEPQTTIYKWLFQLDDEPNLFKITKHPFINSCLGFQVENGHGNRFDLFLEDSSNGEKVRNNKNPKNSVVIEGQGQGHRPLRQAWQNNISPEFVVAVLEKLTTGSSIAEVVFPQSMLQLSHWLVLRFNKRRALTGDPLRGIFLTFSVENSSVSVGADGYYLSVIFGRRGD